MIGLNFTKIKCRGFWRFWSKPQKSAQLTPSKKWVADESESVPDLEKEKIDRINFEQNATGVFDDKLDL